MSIPAQINTLRTFTVFADPGHAWVAVPMDYVRMLGIDQKITPYSFISDSGKTAYLEEDCDVGIFIDAWEKKYNCKPMLRGRGTNNQSKIRNLNHYR